MMRRNSSKKMAVTKEVKRVCKENRLSSSKFKSRLALTLSKHNNNNNARSDSSNQFPAKHGEFILLEDLIAEKYDALPLTICLKKFNCGGENVENNSNSALLSTKLNGIGTLQAVRELTSLKCLATDSNELIVVPINDGSISVNFLSIDNTAVYKTLGEVRSKRRDLNIKWFTSTRNFIADNKNCFGAGQIFAFASQNILSSFKRDRNTRGATLLVYPSLRKLFVPLECEGDFKKCDAPSTSQSCELAEISKSDNFPFFITLPPKNLPDNLKHRVGTQLFVTEKSVSKMVFITRKLHGSLQIHSFPMYPGVYAKAVDTPHIDQLDNCEMNLMLKAFEFGKRDENEYCFKTYNEIGILRLLDEIVTELNHNKEGVYSQLLGTKNVDCKSIQKRVIKTYLRNSMCNSLEPAAHKYLKSIDDIPQNTNISNDVTHTGSHHDYVNNTENHKDTNKTRELVVEFDDGGYVIIPFLGKYPRVSVDQAFMLKYQSTDNIAYNYKEQQQQQQQQQLVENDEDIYGQLYDLTCDQHVYTYISSDHDVDDLNQSHVLTADHVNKKNQSQSDKDEVRYSLAYDYSHIGHFSIPPALSRSHIKEMSLDEVESVLKVNYLKHYASMFREYKIDGKQLEKLTEKDFIEMDFTRFEARKLSCFLDGWRPKEGSSEDRATWLSKLAKDWTVYDVSKYLQHTSMTSLQRFVLRHNVDGFLLKAILNDDVMESLLLQHSLVLKQVDIMRLRNYILEDEKPRFKYFS